MNIILFSRDELDKPLPKNDRRGKHIRKILKLKPGDSFEVGLINGPLGRAVIQKIDTEGTHLSFEWNSGSPALYPLSMIVGLCRPPSARRIIRDLTSLGVSKIMFTGTELSEKSYADSGLWQRDGYLEPLMEGAEQAGFTNLPLIYRYFKLSQCLDAVSPETDRFFLDTDTPGISVSELKYKRNPKPWILAVGAERGWTDIERNLLINTGFQPVRFGERVLRTETAAIAACSVFLSIMGKLDSST